MIPYTPIPAPIFTMGTTPYGGGGKTYNPDNGAGGFVFGGQTLPLAEKGALATAIEKCFYVDLSGNADPGGFDVNGGAFSVDLVHDGTTVSQIKVGAYLHTLVEAASLAHLIRLDTGTTAYSGPAIV